MMRLTAGAGTLGSAELTGALGGCAETKLGVTSHARHPQEPSDSESRPTARRRSRSEREDDLHAEDVDAHAVGADERPLRRRGRRRLVRKVARRLAHEDVRVAGVDVELVVVAPLGARRDPEPVGVGQARRAELVLDRGLVVGAADPEGEGVVEPVARAEARRARCSRT